MYTSKLLNRQIRKYLRGAPIPKEVEGLLGIIDDAYKHYEENLVLLQRALELSSVELNQAKNRISASLVELNERNQDLLSSIHYARLIQNAILPSEERFKKVLPGSFVFHRPRDIVSGDFYWLQEFDDKIMVAAVDCTGHGVPGAFMSIIGNNALNAA
ncbi:MAG: PP2C family protein-serine/threonine phosphatase, partial [Flavobacteriales bacterium]